METAPAAIGSGRPRGSCREAGSRSWEGPSSNARDRTAMAAAILVRLLHRRHVINIRGRSYRLREMDGLFT